MGDSYDDKIETILVTRKKVAERKREQRREELKKQLTVIAGALGALLLVIILIFVGCTAFNKGDKEKETTTYVEETTPEVTTPEETTIEETTEEETEAEEGVMYTTDLLNFRTEPSTEGALIQHLEKGTEVKVLSTENGWVKITYGDHTGYVKEEYLSSTKPE